MIPQVRYSEESGVEEVKARIIACRKRLRNVRAHRIQVVKAEEPCPTDLSTAISGLVSYPAAANLQLSAYPADDGTWDNASKRQEAEIT